jgi:hypothetical protein
VNTFSIRIYNLGKKNIIAVRAKAFVMETNCLNKGASLLIKTIMFYKSSKEFLSQ